jgi:hypothetical protein
MYNQPFKWAGKEYVAASTQNEVGMPGKQRMVNELTYLRWGGNVHKPPCKFSYAKSVVWGQVNLFQYIKHAPKMRNIFTSAGPAAGFW